MLVLRSSPTSPFVRKVKIAAAVLGLSDKIQAVNADTVDPKDDLRQQNPLGKIPSLILEDGETLFDSRVIVAYLDMLAGGGIMVPAGSNRFDVLREEALADGLMDATVLLVYEGRFRPKEHFVQNWLDHQQGKVDRSLAHAEERYSSTGQGKPHIGEITLACALGFLDLRFEGKWRANHPKLVAWLDDFAASVPAYDETAFKG